MAMSKKKKILVIAGCVAGGLVLLLAAAYNVALSSSVICSRWLPMAGRMTNSTMTASEVKLSLFGNSLEVRDFVYASPSGIEVRVDSLQTKIAFIKAISKDIRVNGIERRPCGNPSGAEKSNPARSRNSGCRCDSRDRCEPSGGE